MTLQAFRFDPVELPPAAQGTAQGSARVPRREPRLTRQPPRLRPGVQPQDGRARLDRHDLAEAVRRPRTHRVRTLRGDRGDAGRRRAGRLPLDRRSAERPEHPALRHRRAEGLLPAAHRARRTVVLHRHERAGFRLRSRRHAHPRGEGRWRLPHQRQQAVDLERASRRLHDPVLQDGRRRTGRGRSPCRRDAVPGGPEELARHRDPAGDQPAGRASLQPALPHRPVRPRQPAVRRDRQRLAPGVERTRIRAQRARSVPGAVQAADRDGARRRSRTRIARPPRRSGGWWRSLPRCGGCRCRSPACCRKACSR